MSLNSVMEAKRMSNYWLGGAVFRGGAYLFLFSSGITLQDFYPVYDNARLRRHARW